jgi:hypothetical protein
MIYQIIDLPPSIIGFTAAWEVTPKDFEEVVIPCTEKHVEKMGHSNYMLVLNTIENIGIGSWFKDTLLSLKSISKWHRAAIVSDSKTVNLLKSLIPGELHIFSHGEIHKAIDWLAESDKELAY